jgi:hypothetical protein
VSNDWRPISEPPGEEHVGIPIALVCMPADGSEPTFSNYTLGWLYARGGSWSINGAIPPVGWPPTHWKPLGVPRLA